MIGSRLGPYEITARIGAGGMGEVYRATDTRLGRDVALKVLPAAFASDAERRARFEREARLLASLNHPNIAQVYGFESAGQAGGSDLHFLGMELVEGEDLAERLKRGAIPLDEAIAIAKQIAEALEEAHDKGIVHRDLKPANVKVTPDGKVKVLDFGLAKAWEGDLASGSGPDLSQSPTLARGTQAGIILGTAAYMSPEQARGKAVDKRADIWAFGVVLFEMLSGRQVFAGETVSDTLAAVLRQDIDWAALPAGTPEALKRLLRRCLERDPRQRLHDMADARLEIAEALRPDTSPPQAVTPQPRASRWMAGAVAIALLGWAVTAALLWPRPRPAAQVVRFDILPVGKTTLTLADRPAVDVSADGRRVVFTARLDGVSRLYLRDRADATPRLLPGTESASSPVFSPSGTSIAFFGANALKVVTLDGAVSTLASAAGGDPRGLSWAGPDRIVYAPNAIGPLVAVSASGGAVSAVSKLDQAAAERSHRWPHVLPGARAVLFTVGTVSSPDNYDDSRIDAIVLATGERRTVLTGARTARYVASGHLLFAHGSNLNAVAFDPERLVTQGQPVVLLREVDGDTTTGASHFACADDGTFVYVPGSSQAGLRKMSWLSRDGSAEDVPLPPALFNDVRLAPGGGRFAYTMGTGGRTDIWIYERARKTSTRLTFDGRSATPEWSADGVMVYYASLAENGVTTTFHRKPADGSREAEPLGTVDGRAYVAGLEAGARSAIVNLYGNQRSTLGIFRVVFGGAGQQIQPTPVIDSPAIEYAAQLSADGRWVAFQSSVSGSEEIYVRDLAGTGAQWQVTTTGGEEPHWSADGRELFYRFDRRLMVVPVESRGRFGAGTSRLLLDGIYNLRSDTGISYDVAPAADRFLMIRSAEDGGQSAGVRVVLNMFDELARATKAER